MSIERTQKRAFQFIAIAVLAALFLPGCVLVALRPLPDTVEAEVESAVDHGFDAIIVYVDQPSGTRLYAAGTKSRADQLALEPDALFKIASISKLYVAAAAVMIAGDELLSLDDTLADLMPELDGRIENTDEITLRLLLQHRSGIRDFIDQEGYRWVDPPQSTADTLALVLDLPAEFKPDARRKYSNTNYLLIGEILDRTLGFSHHQYVHSEILEPLGLDHTYNLMSEVDLDDLASGYDTGSEEFDWKVVNYISTSGSMIATAEDTGRFLRALRDGSLFDADEQEAFASVQEYEHTGLLPGYQSIARFDNDTVVVQFTNVSGGDRWSRSEVIYRRITRILHRHE